MFPKDVSRTYPSRKACYHMESPGGVRFLEPSSDTEPCDWTADGLMSDFKEFLEAALKISQLLDGSH